jgi:hypothetical protein
MAWIMVVAEQREIRKRRKERRREREGRGKGRRNTD